MKMDNNHYHYHGPTNNNSSNTNSSLIEDDDDEIELPPGFRFHPTDEELISHYLSPKVLHTNFTAIAIGEVDLNKVEPWDLPSKAKMGEKEWYFFCIRDRKYPTGSRTNRATEAGYWKATGKDKEIQKEKLLIGMKKTLVFYTGRAPKGEKTDWVMHEYRLEGKYSKYNLPKTAKNEWVISRIFKKNSSGKKLIISELGCRFGSFIRGCGATSSPILECGTTSGTGGGSSSGSGQPDTIILPQLIENNNNNNNDSSAFNSPTETKPAPPTTYFSYPSSHVTCFSSTPTEEHKFLVTNNINHPMEFPASSAAVYNNHANNINSAAHVAYDSNNMSMMTTMLSAPAPAAPASPGLLPHVPAHWMQNSVYADPMPQDGMIEYQDPSYIQDQSIIRLLLDDNHGSNTIGGTAAAAPASMGQVFLPDTELNYGASAFTSPGGYDASNSMSSSGPIDLDCLLDY